METISRAIAELSKTIFGPFQKMEDKLMSSG